MWLILFGLILIISLFTFAIVSIRSGIFIKSITQSPFNTGILTFDDGPHPVYTPLILDLLDQYHIKAIFFCIGKNADAHPEIVRRIAESGHLIGNHTFYHSIRSTFYGWKKYLSEINTTTVLLEKITGKKVLYYRPPFGITNPSIAKAIRKSGLVTMAWNIRTFDTLAKDPHRPIRKIEKYWNPHSIILLHDRLNVTVDILQYLLENGLIKQSPIFESQGSGISEDK